MDLFAATTNLSQRFFFFAACGFCLVGSLSALV